MVGQAAERRKSEREDRRFSEKRETGRNRYQQDRDRIYYSAGFRRLAGITQIAAAGEVTLLHNRLTHSLKVGQVGRRLTEQLLRSDKETAEALQLDPDVVETAGLAHDLGHPPFGHAAEHELNKILGDEMKFGGFEGNAQTFRYLTKTAMRRSEVAGSGSGALDLTRASLNAIIKYPHCEADARAETNDSWLDRTRGSSKWNAYQIDRGMYDWVRKGCKPGERSTEAAIMDWSDDVSYAVHDFEDYVRARLIPAHSLRHDIVKFKDFAEADLTTKYAAGGFDLAGFEQAIETIAAWCAESFADPYSGSRFDEHRLNEWVSSRITEFSRAVTIRRRRPTVSVDESAQYLVEVLKRIPVFYVINAPAFAAAQRGQNKIIRELFHYVFEIATERTSMPTVLGELIEDLENDAEEDAVSMRSKNENFVAARSAADFLCTLTEAQAFALHDRLSGSTPSMFYGPWL